MKSEIKNIFISKFKDDLIRHSTLMFLAGMVGSVFNMLYQLYMVRHLSPVDFGVLNSLLALMLIVLVPAGTLQTAVTKFISRFHAHEHWRRISSLLMKMVKIVLVLCVVVFLLFFFFRNTLSSYFHLKSSVPIVILGVLMAISVILPLGFGALQGLQMFGWLGFNGIVGGILKLGMGVLFVSLGFRVIGALSAFVVTNIVLIIIAFVPLKYLIMKKLRITYSTTSINEINSEVITDDEKVNFFEIYKYLIPVAITYLSFMLLINGDIILVKHYFTPLEAGYYSVAQMVGKIIIFLPMAITMVMFPKVSNLNAKGENTLPLLWKSSFITLMLCGTAAFVCILFPSFIIKVLSGETHNECIPLARLFSIAMTFYALVYNLLFYQLSIHKVFFVYPLAISAILQLLLIGIFHVSLSQVLYILCFNSVLLVVVNLSIIMKAKVNIKQ